MSGLTLAVGAFRFRARAGFIVLVAVMVAAMIGAGFWQLDRARQKIEVQAQYEARREAPPVKVVSGELPPPEALRFRRVRLAGRYLAQRQFLLDNRPRPGAGPGYEVLTPLERDGGELVLVNRGWIPAPVDRQALPPVPVDERPREVRGTLVEPERGFTLGAVDASERWPRRIQYIDYQALAERLGRPVYPAVLMLAPAAGDGYRRDWQPVLEGPAKHYGYAVQWFLMAAAVLVLFAFATLSRNRDDAQH